ncbi:endoplasmic reticulum-based factor for assembly of V-ATPase domain-containing protein [Trichoderma longibrachiatum]
MVLLTMTPSIVDALKLLDDLRTTDEPGNDANEQQPNTESSSPSSPASSLEPAVGNPISHSDIIDIHKKLKASQSPAPKYSLEQLLQGSRVYIPPPPPKPEPSEEYKALMARLRREEDARSYERMINPPPPLETFQHRFPQANAAAARAFAEANRPSKAEDLGDDEVTVNEIHRQVMLIINFLVSIAGVAVTLWIAGRWWSLSSRIFLALGGSIVVAVAEVAVYSSYMWRLGDAKSKQGAVKEIKEVVQTWIVGQESDDKGGEKCDEKSVLIEGKEEEEEQVRRRIPAKADDPEL